MRLVFVTALALLTPGIAAQELGDKVSGRRLAEAWCSECHRVLEGEIEVSPFNPPSFDTIANRSVVTPVWLNAFFLTSHPVMPNIVLTPAQRDDISAHILSLKRR